MVPQLNFPCHCSGPTASRALEPAPSGHRPSGGRNGVRKQGVGARRRPVAPVTAGGRGAQRAVRRRRARRTGHALATRHGGTRRTVPCGSCGAGPSAPGGPVGITFGGIVRFSLYAIRRRRGDACREPPGRGRTRIGFDRFRCGCHPVTPLPGRPPGPVSLKRRSGRCPEGQVRGRSPPRTLRHRCGRRSVRHGAHASPGVHDAGPACFHSSSK